MGEHANTYKQPVNGAEHVKFLPQQNGASYNSEHLERGEKSVDNNLPKDAKKKTYTFKDWTVYFLIFSLSLSVIGNIYQGVHNGISLKYSPMDQCPSCAVPCPQGWVVHDAWCYYFSTDEGTWNSSKSNCSSQGGSLTAIDTPSEKNFLMKKDPADYWIGLRREKGQPWKWANGSDFNQRFEFGRDGYCAFLNAPNISSSFCANERRWICRRPHLQA